ncbi:MAG: TIR domain-containing protein [Anaerolineales bacterium]
MGHVFVSYSHKDTKYAHRLAEHLQQIGIDVWIDERLDYGSQWPNEIQKQLDSSDAFIIIMSPRAFASEWVQSELQRAKRKLKPIFPLLLEGDEPWLSVESTQYYDVRNQELPDNKFHSALRRVLSVGESAKPFTPPPKKNRVSAPIIVFAAIIGATCMIVSVALAIKYIYLPSLEIPNPTTVTETIPEPVVDHSATQTAMAVTQGAMVESAGRTATAAWLNADDDGDGLTNEREMKLNTAPNVRDTDGDGLDDGPEVSTFFTDPLNRDTDGDGQTDAQDDTPRIPSTPTPDAMATARAEACFEGDWGPREFAGDLQLLQINRINKDNYSFHGTGGCASNCDWGVIDVPSNWPILDGTFPKVRFVGSVTVEVTCKSEDQLQATITEKSTSGDGVVTPKVYNVILERCKSVTFGWSCSFE